MTICNEAVVLIARRAALLSATELKVLLSASERRNAWVKFSSSTIASSSGNTKEVAEALADGARTAGANVVLINTNERRVMLDDLLNADAVAVGSPDYYGYVAGTIKTFFDDMYIWDKAGKAVTGKPAALFYSHGGGGSVKQGLEKFGGRFFKLVGETVERKPSDAGEAAEKGRALGKELAQKAGQ